MEVFHRSAGSLFAVVLCLLCSGAVRTSGNSNSSSSNRSNISSANTDNVPIPVADIIASIAELARLLASGDISTADYEVAKAASIAELSDTSKLCCGRRCLLDTAIHLLCSFLFLTRAHYHAFGFLLSRCALQTNPIAVLDPSRCSAVIFSHINI